MYIKKSSNKLLYKNFQKFKEKYFFKNKLLKLRKKKWGFLFKKFSRKRLFDHSIYYKSKFGFFFNKKYKFNLLLKQKISSYYGKLSLDFLKSINKKIIKKSLVNSKNTNFKLDFLFFKDIENRLDIVLFRSYFVKSINESRSFIKNGYVYVNSKKITVSSFILKKGDIITLDSFSYNLIKQNILSSTVYNVNYIIPKYLEVNYNTFQIIIFSDIEDYNFSELLPFRMNFKKLNKYLSYN